MTLFCAVFAAACFLVLVFLDEFQEVNPCLAAAGVLTGVVGMVAGGA